MEMTLRISSEAGETVIRLFKDYVSPLAYKEFACTVSIAGEEYRSDIPAIEIQDFLHAAIDATRIPVGGQGAFGLDGTSYTLTIADGQASSTYSWWMTPPEGWEPVANVAGWLCQIGEKVAGRYLL